MDGLAAAGCRLGGRARTLVLGLAALLAAAALLGVGAATASAGLDHELEIFKECPTEVPGVAVCLYSTTTGGEFHLGSKTVPVEPHTIVLQGGLKTGEEELVPAKNGETVSKTPLPLPGGLVGVELIQGVFPPLTEVTATAEPAGTIRANTENVLREEGVGVALPLKVKLSNLALGESCYVGTNSEPISLQLTTGTTNPPGPNTPISGYRGNPHLTADDMIAESLESVLVDNSFAAPGASSCDEPLSVVADEAVDLDSGLPAAAGTNAAVLKGNFYEVGTRQMELQLALPEIGRCVHLKPEVVNRERHFHGVYRDAGCVLATKFAESEYEWEPGAVNKAVAAEGKVVNLETAAKQKITCLESHGSGEYTGVKSATLGLRLTGCTLGKAKETCESSGAGAGTIVANGLEGALGFIKDENVPVVGGSGVNAVVGWDFSHGGSALLTATCGGQAVSVGGSVIAPISVLDKMAASEALKFTQAGGSQAVQSFEEQPTDTLSETIGGGSPDAAGLQTSEKLTAGEHLEVKGVIE